MLNGSPSKKISSAAFLVQPHEGGTFTVFLGMREALKAFGIRLDWVGKSADVQQLFAKFPEEKNRGHLVDSSNLTPDQISRALLEHCSTYDLVFVNVLTSVPEMTVAAYLPLSIRCIMIAHSISPGTYAAAKALTPFIDAVVGVSPRIQRDLAERLKLPQHRISCVPNSLNLQPFVSLQRPARPGKTLRLLCLGRMFDVDKGIFWLPEILARLSDLDVHLTVAGDGDDLPELKSRSAAVADRMAFLGRVSYHDTPALLASHDVLIMPSRFEGFGYTLVEAMAVRCVPVVSRVSGVTDFVVEEEKTGLLFPIGDINAAAQCIRRLATQPALLEQLSNAGPDYVRSKFSLDTFTKGYASVLDSLNQPARTRHTFAGQPVEQLHIGGGWRKYVPLRVKNFLRKYMNR